MTDTPSNKGFTGNLHGIAVLPNTAIQLVEAIQTQKDLSPEDAREMAVYLDERYHMSDYVAADTPLPTSKELDEILDNLLSFSPSRGQRQRPDGTVRQLTGAEVRAEAKERLTRCIEAEVVKELKALPVYPYGERGNGVPSHIVQRRIAELQQRLPEGEQG